MTKLSISQQQFNRHQAHRAASIHIYIAREILPKFCNGMKQYRQIATHYGKRTASYLAFMRPAFHKATAAH